MNILGQRTLVSLPKDKAILLWDGDCGLCRRCVAWAEARDDEQKLRAVPYQQAPSPPMTDELRERCQRAVQLILPDGTILPAGRACLSVMSLLGWKKTAALLSFRPLVWGVEAGYRLAAKNRGRWGRLLR